MYLRIPRGYLEADVGVIVFPARSS